MKKIYLIFSLIVIVNLSFAQEALVKISPFHFVDGTFYTTYERALNNNNSFTLSGGYHLTENGDEYGWMGELQIRKYVVKPKINSSSESPLSGIYAGLYANGKYFLEHYEWYRENWEVEPYYDENGQYQQGTGYSYDLIDQEYDIKQIEAGVVMGIQMIFSDNFSLDFFLGGGLRSSKIDNKPTNVEFYSPDRGYTGIVPKIGFEVGLAL